MSRFELSDSQYKKLCELIKEREWDLCEVYHEYFHEYPPEEGEVHHATHRGNYGADMASNLVFLSWRFHRLILHGLDPEARRKAEKAVHDYLHSDEVIEWMVQEKELLEAIYSTEPETRLKRKRKKYGIRNS